MAKNWAIAIGINEYVNLPNLSYAQRDAELMQDYFLKEAGFEKVYLFTDSSLEITDAGKSFKSQPTYGTLKRFLRVRFNDPFLSTGDNLWFFFSGHGLRHNERDYLMLSDTDPDPEGVEHTAIPIHYVTERLRRCGADNIILVLDACRNELRSKGSGVGEQKHQGIITIASCSPAEIAFEIEQLQQSSFTYALLESLRIQGEDNCATVEKLYQRLLYRVPEINHQYSKPRQNPYARIEPPSKYHLILLPKQATEQDIAILREDAKDAEIEGKLELAKQLWIRVLAVSPANPKALEALERIWRKQDRVKSNQELYPVKAQPTISTSEVAKSQPKLDAIEPTPTERKVTLKVFEFDVVNVEVQRAGFLGLSSTVKLNRSRNQAKYFSEDLGNGLTLDMVYIPGGKFFMGTDDEEIERLCKKYNVEYFRSEKPQHEVTIQPFFMGKFQVTNAQWKAIAYRTDLKVEQDLDPNPAYFRDYEDSDRLPVEQVSWEDAVEFCQRLSRQTGKTYRLPSEAEWEYACRSVISYCSSVTREELTVEEWNQKYNQPFHFGETITTDLANYNGYYTYASQPKGEYRQKTTTVGSFPPNAFGLYDMHGNFWEWCEDDWHNDYQGAPTDGSAWLSGSSSNKVIFGISGNYSPGNCRSAFRNIDSRDVRNGNIGFRVVCVASRIT